MSPPRPTRLSRRRFLGSLAGLGAGALVPGCADRQRPLRIAAGIWQGYEPLFLAQRLGWLAAERAAVAELPSNAGSLRAITSGIVDGAALTLDEVLRARNKGLPLGIALVFDISAGADMLLARPAIATLRALRGRRLGRARGTNADLLLALALAQAGLVPGDLRLVDVAFGDQWSAWEQDRVDALITYPPMAERLLADGARRLFDTRDAQDSIVDVLALRGEVLDDPAYAPALRGLIAAHFRALDLLRTQPQQAAGLMAGHLGLPVAEVLASYDGLVLPDLAANRRLLGGEAPLLVASARRLLRIMAAADMLTVDDDLSGLVTDRFLPAAPTA